MNAIENIPEEDGFGGNNPVEPDQDETQRQLPDRDADLENPPGRNQNDNNPNNENIPSEIVNDDVPDEDALDRKFPDDDSNIGDNPIYPDKDDIVPKSDRSPSGIRNDNPSETGI